MLRELFIAWFGALTFATAAWESTAARCRRRSYRIITCGQLQAMVCANTMVGGIIRLCGQGIDPQDVKYLEWSVAAPLMVTQACVIACVDRYHTRVAILQTIGYCICGIIASRTSSIEIKSTVTLLGMALCLYVVERLVRDGLAKPGVPHIAKVQVFITLCTWPLYVLVWCAGPHCLGTISSATEETFEMLMGMTLKTANMHVLLVDSERTVVFDIDEAVNKSP